VLGHGIAVKTVTPIEMLPKMQVSYRKIYKSAIKKTLRNKENKRQFYISMFLNYFNFQKIIKR